VRAQAIRRWIGTLRHRPVHPQWLIAGTFMPAFYRVLAAREPRLPGGVV